MSKIGCMHPLRSWLAGMAIAIAATTPVVALAQSTASEYTNAVRVDNLGREVGTIAADPDGSGPIKHAATRTIYDHRQLPVLVEIG